MRVIGLTVGPIEENTYVAADPASGTCVVVDPGAEPERILAAVREAGGSQARVVAIVLTHAHLDHVGAVAELRERTRARVWLHPDDAPLYRAAPEEARAFGWSFPTPPEPDAPLADGGELAVGGVTLRVRHAPGHSPGHVVLVGVGAAFVGDCIFAGSIGRTDLPGGDGRALLRSIERTILSLPDETVLYPGHGPATTVGRERATNPFLVGLGGERRCVKCDAPLPKPPRGCRKAPCPNCAHLYPVGDCSDA
jgi:glyoxylase-like metal-dependent hydrolase (beta-lactamase superfamily II)